MTMLDNKTNTKLKARKPFYITGCLVINKMKATEDESQNTPHFCCQSNLHRLQAQEDTISFLNRLQ